MNTEEKNNQVNLIADSLVTSAATNNVDDTISLLQKLVAEHHEDAKEIFDLVLKKATYQLMTKQMQSLETKYMQDKDLESFKRSLESITETDKMRQGVSGLQSSPSESDNTPKAIKLDSIKIPVIDLLLEKLLVTQSLMSDDEIPLFVHLTLDHNLKIFNPSESSSEESLSDNDDFPVHQGNQNARAMLKMFESLQRQLKARMSVQDRIQEALIEGIKSFTQTISHVALEKSKSIASYPFKSVELNQMVTDNLILSYQYITANQAVIMDVINQQIDKIDSGNSSEDSSDDSSPDNSDAHNMKEMIKSMLMNTISPLFAETLKCQTEALTSRGIDVNTIPKIQPMTSEELTQKIESEKEKEKQEQTQRPKPRY